MTNRLIHYILYFLLLSCSSINTTTEKYTSQNVWKTIDTFFNHLAIDKVVELNFKEKPETYNIENQRKISWLYTNKENNFQRFSFLFDLNMNLESFSYYPAADSFSDFNLDSLLKKWKNYECKQSDKIVSNKHRTTIEKNIICLNGKITISLNKYDEVESISFLVKK